MNGLLCKIQVKTTRYKENGKYIVLLKNCGGASGKSITRLFDNTQSDYLFICTGDDEMYLIPTSFITARNSITLGKHYAQYKIANNSMKNLVGLED